MQSFRLLRTVGCSCQVPSAAFQPRRNLFLWDYFLVPIFNRYDKDMVKEVGPDIAAARWLLRNGAVIWWKDDPRSVEDYNLLPKGQASTMSGGRKYLLERIDATDAMISNQGFKHLQGLKHVKAVRLIGNPFVGNGGVAAIADYLKEANSVQEVEIISVPSVNDRALLFLGDLKSLRLLYLYNLVGVENRHSTLEQLREALPKCDIQFPETNYDEKIEDVFKRKDEKGKKA